VAFCGHMLSFLLGGHTGVGLFDDTCVLNFINNCKTFVAYCFLFGPKYVDIPVSILPHPHQHLVTLVFLLSLMGGM
jgi:hypothetical protein